jgi:hypothetical protein
MAASSVAALSERRINSTDGHRPPLQIWKAQRDSAHPSKRRSKNFLRARVDLG